MRKLRALKNMLKWFVNQFLCPKVGIINEFAFYFQVDVDIKTQIKNGKKICWNYRKGRCRFGSNCTYAHDSDLHVDDSTESHINNEQLVNHNLNQNNEKSIVSRKVPNRRPGLGDSIIPSKKVMRNYYKTQ